MIPWWVGVISLMAGAAIGIGLVALLTANDRGDPDD